MEILNEYRDFIIGSIIPILAYIIADTQWPSKYKALLSLGLSLVFAAIMVLLENDMSAENIKETVITVIATAQAVYVIFMKTLNIEQYIAPQEAVITKAKDTIVNQIPLTRQQARAVLDITQPDDIHISVTHTLKP